jgi:hypothetical protein
MNMLFTHKLSTFVGRAIPIVGWVILARDVTDISFHAVRLYNNIDDTLARVMAPIEPWNGQSLITLRKKTLMPNMSINLDMKLDPEDAAECLQNVFDAFGMDTDQVTFSLYYSKKPARPCLLLSGC